MGEGIGGEYSCGAGRWRDRMDNQTFFTSLIFKMMYSIVLSHPILFDPIMSHLVIRHLTRTRVVTTSFVFFVIHKYLFFYISFLYEHIIITQLIHLCVRVCFLLSHSIPFYSILFLSFIIIKATWFYFSLTYLKK